MSEVLHSWRIIATLHRQRGVKRVKPNGQKVLMHTFDDMDVLCTGDTPLECKQKLKEIAAGWNDEKWKEFKSFSFQYFWGDGKQRKIGGDKDGWGKPRSGWTPEMLSIDIGALRMAVTESERSCKEPLATKRFVDGASKRTERIRKKKKDEGEPEKEYSPIVHRFIPGRGRSHSDPVEAGELGLDKTG